MSSPISMSTISGLISGMDTTSLISQLMQIEARPQTQLKTRLAAAQTDAAAYRDVNSAFAALRSAATALTQSSAWSAAKATSDSTTVTAGATAGATPGSLTFTVDQLAAAHSVVTGQNWATTTDAFGLGSSLTLTKADGTTTAITFGGTGTLADAITAINAAGAGVTATAINTGSGYRLQVASSATGAANAFTLSASGGTPSTFSVLTQGQDAAITVGSGTSAFQVTSTANTFTGVLPDTSFTVSKANTTATVTVATDPDAVTAAVQSLVTAANTALSKIATYSGGGSGSTAPLQGDQTLADLAGHVLDAVSSAVGGNSAALAGIQLTRDGRLTFDATAFKGELAANPALVQSILGGSTAVGTDGIPGTADDTVATDGIGARLAVLAGRASDSATGMLTALATGKDNAAQDVQSQIDDWTLRLQLRQQTLTAQFTAMETALGTLKNQSSWLTSQISALPSWTTTK